MWHHLALSIDLLLLNGFIQLVKRLNTPYAPLKEQWLHFYQLQSTHSFYRFLIFLLQQAIYLDHSFQNHYLHCHSILLPFLYFKYLALFGHLL